MRQGRTASCRKAIIKKIGGKEEEEVGRACSCFEEGKTPIFRADARDEIGKGGKKK